MLILLFYMFVLNSCVEISFDDCLRHEIIDVRNSAAESDR